MKRYLIIFRLLLLPVWGFSQETNVSDIIISIAEDLAADEEDPQAVEVFIERLQELAENPVKVNISNDRELSRLFFLSDFQVKALADYVHSTGQIVSEFELANIPGFDRETAEMIIPFISLENKQVNNSDSARWRNSIISNFSLKSGNNDASSLGSDWKILTKYKFTAGEFSGGITMEKDPGEQLLSGKPPLPDFLSAHLAFSGNGIIKRIIIGDFSARFGQGTNINTGTSRGISLVTPGYMSASDEIKPYTSTEENKFFRGVAAEFSVRNMELSMYFSKNFRDATIVSSTNSENDYVESFYTAGLHNTLSLLQKKDAVSILAYGISFSYNFNNLKVGLVWSENRFSLPIDITGNDPEKVYDFKGDHNNIYTIYYNTFIKKILLYGELSANEKNKYAIVQGISFRPSDRLTLNLIFRNYNPGFTTFFGQGSGAGSKTSNERGILGNFSFEAAKHLFLIGGCDIHYFPWLKYRCSAPSFGVRKEIKASFQPTERVTFDATYNYRLSLSDSAEAQGIPDQKMIITRSLKASVRYSVYDKLVLGTRIDFNYVNPGRSRGAILFQEISYSFRKVPVTLWARYCLFKTDDWDSRVYTYENDLLYSYSIPALSGEGSRSYIMAKWKISDFAELRVKYGITSSVATGKSSENSEEIKMQFRIWF
ncbi:MAG: hypothetical protein WA816_16250 [Bacteroidales bacterium]